MAWLRNTSISREEQEMYIKRLTSMNVPFSFQTAHAMAKETALLDSGATENFIDKATWKRMKVGRQPLVKLINVYNVDGTENKQGEMTHYCRLRITYNNQEDLQGFYIMNLGKDRLILGYPFL
jgi:gag-polyprotein putative aspartyl protease